MHNSTISMRIIKDEYESLRCNILGRTNCCRGLVVFLHQGMVAWVSMLQTTAKQKTKKTGKPAHRPAGIKGENVVLPELAAMLVDVIIAAHALN